MSEHRAAIRWQRQTPDFAYDSYNRAHTWSFDAGVEVPASSAPEYTGDADRVDPEEGFVATISGCHMLTFLAVAARKRFVVNSYSDDAVGYLEKDDDGKVRMTRVILRPRVEFGGERLPSAAEIDRLHEVAHEHCFISNSVTTAITIENP